MENTPSDGTHWQIDNKCYNGLLYSCQCLEVGVIMRYCFKSSPNFTVTFNGIKLNNCPKEPSCGIISNSTNNTCPYSQDPEAATLCALYAQLQGLQSGSGSTIGPYSGSSASQVVCPYIGNPTSALQLCSLWCQIQAYYSKVCMTCPFLRFTDSTVLCQLWAQISQAISSSGLISGSSSASGAVPYSSCPYSNLTDGVLACYLWCELQTLTTGRYCVGGPVCPYAKYPAPYNEQLCILWAENVGLKKLIYGSGSGSGSGLIAPLNRTAGLVGQFIICPYLNSSFSAEFCSLWCDNQVMIYGSICVTCPYTKLTNADVLCQLWTNLIKANATLGSGSGSLGSGTVPYKNCPYQSLVDGTLACELWCELQEASLYLTCSGGPICPYENYTYPHNNELCKLWALNVDLKRQLIMGSGSGSGSKIPLYGPGNGSTVVCPYTSSVYSQQYCMLWCENQNMMYGYKCAICPYSKFTNADVLCNLWLQLVQANGSLVSSSSGSSAAVPYKNCPYLLLTDGVLACELWCEVLRVTQGLICIGAPTCPYKNYPAPDNSALCVLWAENIDLKSQVYGSGSGSRGSGSPLSSSSSGQMVLCPYLYSPYASDYCKLWCENQYMMTGVICFTCKYEGLANADVLCSLLLQIINKNASLSLSSGINSGSSSSLASGSIPYSSCPFNSLTNGILACQLWCQLQKMVTGLSCSGGPSCPYQNYTVPHNDALCLLWAENQFLKSLLVGSGSGSSLRGPLLGSGSAGVVFCPYTTSMYSLQYCSLWCENQFLKYGSICLNSCPFAQLVESTLLCQLYNSLQLYGVGSGSGSTGSSPASWTGNGLYTGPLNSTVCPYSNLTDGALICQMYCQLLKLKTGLCCDQLPACPYENFTDSSVLCPLWATVYNAVLSGKKAPTNGTVPYSTCPYQQLTDGVLACELWCEANLLIQGLNCTGGPVCPYSNYSSPNNINLCQLWAENIALKNMIKGSGSQGSLSTPLFPLYLASGSSSNKNMQVLCPYENSVYAQDYCSLWCQNKNMELGVVCVYSCPYFTMVNGPLLCQLYNSLSLYGPTSGSGSSSSASSPMTNMSLYTGTFNESSCPYLNLTNGALVCSLWCQLLFDVTGYSCALPVLVIQVGYSKTVSEQDLKGRYVIFLMFYIFVYEH